MKFLDLGQMKKVATDGETSTFKHAKGHEIKILHRALPRIQQEQIKRIKMDAGGQVQDTSPPEPNKKNAEEMQKGATKPGSVSEGWQNIKTGLGMAEGGEVKHYDKGTPDAPVSSDDDEEDQSGVPAAKEVTPAPANVTIINHPPAAPAGNAQAQPVGIPAQKPIFNPNEPAPFSQPQQAPVAAAPVAQPAPAQPMPAAEDEFSRKGSEINRQAAAALQNKLNQQQDAYLKVKQSADDLRDYYKQNPINPNHWAESLDSEQKMKIAIGAGLMAFGGQGNVAFDFIKNQIQKDVEAQEKNSENRKTLFGAYNEMYGDARIATEMATASTKDIVGYQMAQAAMSRGPKAIQAAQTWNAQKDQENDQTYKNVAAQLANGKPSGTPDRILNADASSKYQSLLYDPTKTDKQRADIQQQYNDAIQVDKALSQIEQLWPQLTGKATVGGYLANKVNPNLVGGLAATGAEIAGAAGAIPTGGASLVGAIPGALAAGAAGTALGHGVKQGLRAIGGQTETQYETAKASLEGYIGSALSAAHLTPTETGELVDKFVPTAVDSAETAEDKLRKLKEKIISLTKTGALDSAGMTNRP